MGDCLSRKGSTTPSKTPCPSAISDVSSPPPPDPNKNKSCDAEADPKTLVVEKESVKKEVFVIKHSNSHDSRHEDKSGVIPTSEAAQICSKTTATSNNVVINGGGSKDMAATAPARTSSCTKEEVDAILIQCGRLSRSSSGKAASGGRKYSGSKRSYDFDHHDGDEDGKKSDSLEDDLKAI